MEAKAGLVLKISAIKKLLMAELAGKVDYKLTDVVAVQVTGMVEYITAEILELSGNTARDKRRVRITTGHIIMAIRKDDELCELFDAKNNEIFTTNDNISDDIPKLHTWTYKVLRQVHPDTGITADGSRFVDALINKFIKLLATKFPDSKNNIDIPTIAMGAMPGELAKHAISEANKAETRLLAKD